MYKKKPVIGLLGGLGPQSTGEFYLALILKFQQRYQPANNVDYPQILINSIPAPELTNLDQASGSLITGLAKILEVAIKYGVAGE